MTVAASLLIILLVAWTIVGYLSTRGIEKPEYEVIRESTGYEIRRYTPHIQAKVSVTGGFEAALNTGFRKVADYIFGNNRTGASVAMTSPVLSESKGNSGQAIAMTAPVLHEGGMGEDTHEIAFVMPSEYTMATLPQPNNPEVRLLEIPEKHYAVLKFRGYATARRVVKKIEALNAALERDGVEVMGRPILAQYDPPWTPPYMRQNEVWLTVRQPKDESAT